MTRVMLEIHWTREIYATSTLLFPPCLLFPLHVAHRAATGQKLQKTVYELNISGTPVCLFCVAPVSSQFPGQQPQAGGLCFYFKEHGSLLSGEVTGQDVPQPDDDTMAAMKTSVVHGVFPGEKKV